MPRVGIIANPQSGKDIRRLVTLASSFSNHEKVLILRRVLAGLAAAGVREALVYNDSGSLGEAALDGLGDLPRGVKLKGRLLSMTAIGDGRDTTLAANTMAERGVSCIVVVGGDGTSRAAAKGCGNKPLVPLSTGTNNAFPMDWEGTVAGLGAGLYALHPRRYREQILQTKRLRVRVRGHAEEIALIDVAVLRTEHTGARAIWDLDNIEALALTQGRPGVLGLSAIGASVDPVGPEEPHGIWLEFGSRGERRGKRVLSPIGPGLLAAARIRMSRRMIISEPVELSLRSAGVLAFDGERELSLGRGDKVQIQLDRKGPLVLDAPAILEKAAKRGHLSVFGRNGLSPR